MAATPPITPPAIAPAGDFDEEPDDFGADVGDAEGEDVLPLDPGLGVTNT